MTKSLLCVLSAKRFPCGVNSNGGVLGITRITRNPVDAEDRLQEATVTVYSGVACSARA